ncbi:MAG TPA: HisS family protein [Candidatus Paceibacterota bacterium]|nr:HisS family protein [Candidatus Paceibacterota bacterium]
MSKKNKLEKSNEKVKGLEGVDDVSPEKSKWWKMIQRAGEKTARMHHFHYVETPVIEKAELFERALGEDTKAANKKLFTFKAGTRTKMALRPDILIPIMRSYLEHQLGHFSFPLKAYAHGPVFIKNRKGEKRQFRKFGFQIIGGGSPVYDAQVVVAMIDLLGRLKIRDPVLKVNIAGCRECRPEFRKKLKHYYRYHKDEICKDCKKRYETDILRLLRCDKDKCKKVMEDAPNILDHLCDECEKYFQDILELIEDNEINYIPDPYLLGDKDYHNRLVFEIYPEEGCDTPVVTGGREDYLSERIGGPSLDATGAVLDLDSLVKYLRSNGFTPKIGRRKKKVFFIAIGGEAKKSSITLMNRFRYRGVVVLESMENNTLKTQLKIAERSDAGLVLIYGQKEVFEDTVMIRELDSGSQESIPLEKMVDEAKRRLKKINSRN